jgi:HAE1 family hydrophobic/amphiphilic exporter-1
MKLSDFSVERPVTITMVVLAIMLIGVVSLTKLPIDLFPEMNLPYVAVITNYTGADPEEIEKTVTRPIEESMATVDNIDELFSTSSEGSSMVLMALDWGTDMDFATLDMREKIDRIEEYLPEDASKPMVLKFDPSQMPIMQIAISGGSLEKLKKIAEDKIKPNLERISGVASANITGGREREIQINVDQERLLSYGLSLDSLSASISQGNLNLSGGSLEYGNKKLLVKTVGEFTSVDEIKELEILTPQGQKIALADVATVEDTYKEVNTYAYLNGEASIGLVIQKQSGTNTVKVATAVKKELENIKDKLQGEIEVKIVMNQATFIEDAVNNVKKSAIQGAILAIIILFIFLRDIRSTFIIATTIPISIITAFILMYFADLTLNLMTLGAVALGVGMLVDNAIVVLENIYRHRQESESRIEAAKKGTAEVGTAILASTLTTGAVFLPLVFVEGLASQLFGSFALTVTFSLVASLIMALTLIPMLSSKLLKVKKQFSEEGQEFQFGAITRAYRSLLKRALKMRYILVVVMVLGIILFGAGLKTGIIPLESEFIPDSDRGTFNVTIKLPQGERLEETEEVLNRVEDYIEEIPEVDIIYSRLGGTNMIGLESTNTNEADISVELVELDKRNRSTVDVVEELRGKVRNIAGADIKVTPQSSIMGGGDDGSPIEVRLQGPDLETLINFGDKIVKEAKQVEGARNVELSISKSRPEIQVVIDRRVAKELGFSESQIAFNIKNAVKGNVITQYKEAGEEFDVRVQLQDKQVDSINKLKDLKLISPTGVTVTLAEVADIGLAKGPNKIDRHSQERMVTVGVQLYKRSLSEVQKDIEVRINKLNIPDGYTIEYAGQAKDMQESFGDLALALILAVVLVYMVMAAQFESLVHPFTIMFTVPLALIGAILGLAIVGVPLSVPGIIGMIMLAGIVVNNAIVLIDYINTRRNYESREEAILNAGPIRLRPIMMTTLTTVLGMLPMALGLGEGAESQQPMAVVVVAGLTFSTILTLVVIPAMYSIVDDISSFIKGLFARILHGEEKEEIIEV